MKKSGRSMYEHMGNKRWRTIAAQEERGQVVMPGLEQPPAFDLDERYTTRETLAWCMTKAGVDAFDLDVAACDEAHCAPNWYDVLCDGLRQPWTGRVWCNPPYSDIGPWVKKAWAEHKQCERIAMLLPATRTEQPWWQEDVEPLRDQDHSFLATYFVPGRARFGLPGNPLGVGVGSPPFGCVLLVWR